MMPQTTEQWIAFIVVTLAAFLLRGFFPNLKLPGNPSTPTPAPSPDAPKVDESFLKKLIDEILKQLKDQMQPPKPIEAAMSLRVEDAKPAAMNPELISIIHKLLDERREAMQPAPMAHSAVKRDDLPWQNPV